MAATAVSDTQVSYLTDGPFVAPSVADLVRVAAELGAPQIGGPLSGAEQRLLHEARSTRTPLNETLDAVARAIRLGADPLGEAVYQLRPQAERRPLGAFYTPSNIVEPMVDWVLARNPERIVDAGCGSGRFAAAVARRELGLEIVAIDIDPLPTLLTRATLATLGATRARVMNEDYTQSSLPPAPGRTAFIGNPPYVRHHALPVDSKAWAAATARRLGHSFSRLAGLHAHFFLATAALAQPGDIGCFVTSSEWLDVGYGSIIRELLANGLGAQSIHAIDPSAAAFDAQATAVISCFEVGSSPDAVCIRQVHSPDELWNLDLGVPLPKHRFIENSRWTSLLVLGGIDSGPSQRLGDLVEVHRGLVTGANDYFVLTGERARALGLRSWCRRAITDAREILRSGGVLADSPLRRMVLAVPKDINRSAFPALDSYLRLGEQTAGGAPPVASRYITSRRRPWWYLGRLEAPPIVASYMARQAPAFALNPDGLILLNIGHGLYPRRPMVEQTLGQFVAHLNQIRSTFRGRGRTYQGGLEKFEPREMEALMLGPLPTEEGLHG